MKNFGEKLRQARIAANLTLEELSKASGISTASLQRYETGLTTPTMEKLQKIIEAISVELDYLLGNTSRALNVNDFTFISYIIDQLPIGLTYEGNEDKYYFYPPEALKHEKFWEDDEIFADDKVEKIILSPEELKEIKDEIVDFGKYKIIELIKTKTTTHNRPCDSMFNNDFKLELK